MRLTPATVGIIKRLLIGRSNRPLRSIIRKLEAPDLAALLAQVNNRELKLLFDVFLSTGTAADVLLELPESQIEYYLDKLDDPQFRQLVYTASEDDAAYFLRFWPEDPDNILKDLPEAQQNKIRQFLNYPAESAGRLMQPRVFSVPVDLTAGQALDVLRARAREQSIYYIYCTNLDQQLIGVVSLRELATCPIETPLRTIVKDHVVTVKPDTPEDEVAQIVSRHGFIAIPVVDDHRQLLGVITIDDVVELIQEQATAKIYAGAGLQEDDRIYTPAWTSIKNRAPWMFINLFLAALASSVVSLFEETMAQLIVLASLKNIVAGLGGNTAIQSLTVVTRGLATGDFNFTRTSRVIVKEVTVGLVMGAITGLAAGVLTYFWKGNAMVSAVIVVSMFLNSLVAAFFGATVPMLINQIGRDPAIGSGVIVTMITDIFSFFSFLGIAALALHLFAL